MPSVGICFPSGPEEHVISFLPLFPRRPGFACNVARCSHHCHWSPLEDSRFGRLWEDLCLRIGHFITASRVRKKDTHQNAPMYNTLHILRCRSALFLFKMFIIIIIVILFMLVTEKSLLYGPTNAGPINILNERWAIKCFLKLATGNVCSTCDLRTNNRKKK